MGDVGKRAGLVKKKMEKVGVSRKSAKKKKRGGGRKGRKTKKSREKSSRGPREKVGRTRECKMLTKGHQG